MAADALRPVLRQFDVDEDTFASLVEIVADADSDNAGSDARAFAAVLEEQLEPFLLAFGAEPTGIPGAAMQVAVSLRGMATEDNCSAQSSQAMAGKDETPAAVAAKPEPCAKPVAAKAGGYAAAVEPPKAPLTLASFCSTSSGASKPKTHAKNPQDKNGTATGPRTLGALWATQADPLGEAATAWNVGVHDGLGGAPEAADDEDNEDDEGPAEQSQPDVRTRQRLEKEERRARRIAAATAAAAAERPPMTDEDFSEIALHGLRETRQSLDDGVAVSSAGRGTRGAHVEGAGSRVVHLEGLSLKLTGEHGSVELLREADLHLRPGHVYGLVGKNGSGKTTLMRRLAAKALPGLPKHLRFSYLAQELGALHGDQTVLEAVVNSDVERAALLKERDDLDAVLAGAEECRDADARAAAEVQAKRFLEIEQQLEAIDASGAEDRAREVLTWFNFDKSAMDKSISTLSGGWRMRAALAQCLCARPDVLLLDEPTNHLDMHGVLWLQKHLRQEWGEDAKKKDFIAVLVSHDRSFLDDCATDILEIHDCKIRCYTGNYSAYIDRLNEEQRNLQKKRDDLEKEETKAKRELALKKKKAREHEDSKKVRQLKEQAKKNEKMFKLMSQRELASGGGDRGPIEDIVAKLREDTSLRFRFPEVDDVPDANLIELDNATVRRGCNVVLKNLVLTLDSRSRVAIVGGNGAGKSTLMRALVGELKAEEGPSGRGRRHASLSPGFVSQDHLERQKMLLHGNCVDYLRNLLPDAEKTRGAAMTQQSDDSVLRAHLGNFGLGRDALKKVGYLSGGQRARLSLAASTWWGPNALFLDEPTNHLDVDSLDALSLGLQAFEGAVVVVSHNRGFVRALCDELWVVQNGTVKACPRGEEAFDEYFSEYTRSVQASLCK